ncbi:MAG: hypothetical protein IPN86_06970 [Saprospiraceae bacterium]|nr:hypothetical protein [Saprospiraceae bacterium]
MHHALPNDQNAQKSQTNAGASNSAEGCEGGSIVPSTSVGSRNNIYPKYIDFEQRIELDYLFFDIVGYPFA